MKRKLLSTKTKGFSLVETLTYLAILMIIAASSITFLLSLDDLIDQYRMETMLYRSGSNVMEQILLRIRESDTVDIANTVEEAPGSGQLALDNDTGSVWFTLSGDELRLVLDGTDVGNLVGGGVVVDGFTVYHYVHADGEFVRVRLDLTGTVGSVVKSTTLYGGAVVRGSL